MGVDGGGGEVDGGGGGDGIKGQSSWLGGLSLLWKGTEHRLRRTETNTAYIFPTETYEYNPTIDLAIRKNWVGPAIVRKSDDNDVYDSLIQLVHANYV